jgi:hypothetical protein
MLRYVHNKLSHVNASLAWTDVLRFMKQTVKTQQHWQIDTCSDKFTTNYHSSSDQHLQHRTTGCGRSPGPRSVKVAVL